MTEPTPQQLVSFIRDFFDAQEIADLCFQLGIESDELSGSTRGDKARELVNYMKRRDQLPRLQEELALERAEAYTKRFPAQPGPVTESTEPAELSVPEESNRPRQKSIPFWAWLSGVLVVIAAAVLTSFVYPKFNYNGSSDEGELVSPQVATRISEPTTGFSATHTLEPTATAAPTLSPEPQAGDKRTVMRNGIAIEQVYVPVGSYMMGSEDGVQDERPAHEVTINAFWIDRTEVTNRQYEACVATGVCDPPSNDSSATRNSYYGNDDYADHPVIYVNWNQASEFCREASGRLPTEAEWEYAARGPNSLTYPWGEELPTCERLNFGFDCIGDTSETGAYPDGISWVGIFDMAGNVWEWVGDWYSENYYEYSPTIDPTGPETGDYRVMRGGSWGYNDPFRIRSSYRNILNYPHFSGFGVGFRCVSSD